MQVLSSVQDRFSRRIGRDCKKVSCCPPLDTRRIEASMRDDALDTAMTPFEFDRGTIVELGNEDFISRQELGYLSGTTLPDGHPARRVLRSSQIAARNISLAPSR